MKKGKLKDYIYKSSFSSVLKAVADEEKNKFLAVASLDALKKLIPSDAFSIGKEDLLPIAANACVVNLVNKNDDVIDTETTLVVYKHFINKFIDMEHDRTRIIGHIVASELSAFDANYLIGAGSDIITEESVKGKLAPFNISLAGYLYRLIEPSHIDGIVDANDPNDPNYMTYSLSWELGFDTYKLAIGSPSLTDAEIIDDPTIIEKLSPLLRMNGGSGKMEDGRRIYRYIYGDVLPLGVGITFSPAAPVKGIIVQEAIANIVEDSSIPLELSSLESISKENDEIISQKGINDVNNNNKENQSIMRKKILSSIAELKDLTDENIGEYSVASLKGVLDADILKISEEWSSRVQVEKDALAAANLASEEAKRESAANKERIDAITLELQTLKDAQALAEKEDKFNGRMSHLDNEYNLDDDDRVSIASDIKDLDEAAFDKWLSSFAKYAKNKNKAFILENTPAPKPEAIASVTDPKDALDNVVADGNQAGVANTIVIEETLLSKYANAFSPENVKFTK